MYSARVASKLLDAGFPIRRSTDQRLLTAPRGLSQFCHVLHRLLVPRHPPSALTSLTTENLIAQLPRSRLASSSRPPERSGRRSSHVFVRRHTRRVNPRAVEYPRRKHQPMHLSRGVDLVLGLMRISTSFVARGLRGERATLLL